MTTTNIDTMTDEDWDELRKKTIFVRVKKTSTTVSAILEWGVHVPAINGAFMEKAILPPLELGDDYNRAMESHIGQCRTYVKQHAIGEGIESKRKDGIPLVYLEALVKTFAEYSSFYMMTTDEYDIFKEKIDVRIAEYNHALEEFITEYPQLVEEHKQLVLQGMERQLLTTYDALNEDVSKKSFTDEAEMEAYIEELTNNFSLNADDTLLATFSIELPKDKKRKRKTSRIQLKVGSKRQTKAERDEKRQKEYTTVHEVFFFTGRQDLKDAFNQLALAERQASTYPSADFVRSKHTLKIPIKELPSMDLVKAKLNLMRQQTDEKQEETIEREKELGSTKEVEVVISADEFKRSFGKSLAKQRDQLQGVLEKILKSYFGTSTFNRVLLWGDNRSAKIVEFEEKQMKLLNGIHAIMTALQKTELFNVFDKKDLVLTKSEATLVNVVADAMGKIKSLARSVSLSTLKNKNGKVKNFLAEMEEIFKINHSAKDFPNVTVAQYTAFNKELTLSQLVMDQSLNILSSAKDDSVQMSRATLNGLIGQKGSGEVGLMGQISSVGTEKTKEFSERLSPFVTEFENILDAEGPNRGKSFIDPINGMLDVYKELVDFQRVTKAAASLSKQKKSKGLL